MRVDIKRNYMGARDLDSCGSWYGKMSGCGEHVKEHFGSLKCREFPDNLWNH
jgi:hypothetical protein